MAWTHHEWLLESTPAGQLAALRAHIAEVSLKISADTSAHGYSRSTGNLVEYLKQLKDELKELLGAGAGVAGGVSVVRFAGPS